MLPLQVGPHVCIRAHLVTDGITEVNAAENKTRPGPFPSGRMPPFQREQHHKGDSQPHRKERVRDKEYMEGYTRVIERFEPAGTIRVEGVDEVMHEKLETEKQTPVPEAHPASAKKPPRPPCQQGRHDHDKKKGMCNTAMCPYIPRRIQPG